MLKRTALFLLAFIAAMIISGLAYFQFRRPDQLPAVSITVESTPTRIARGKYLFNHVSNCAVCHSDIDHTRFGEPVKPGGYAKGRVWAKDLGLPGDIVSPNLTADKETGVGAWTDGELIRAIREGVSRDGTALFPLMPYPEFREMSDDDVQSIVAYMRTIPAVRNELPRTSVNFPINLLIKSAPKPVRNRVSTPAPHDSKAYGRYLSIIAGCRMCHTPTDKGEPKPGMEYAGGESYGSKESGMLAVSFNLTPDNNTGIGTWNEEQFLDKFRQYKDYAAGTPPPMTTETFTVMPWLNFTGIEESDLKAIFAYLKTLKPIAHPVETRPLAAKKS